MKDYITDLTQNRLNLFKVMKRLHKYYLHAKYIKETFLGHGILPTYNRESLLRTLQNCCFRTDVDLSSMPPDEQREILKHADAAMAGRVSILGGIADITTPNWHRDFKTGHVWVPGKFHRRYRTTNTGTNDDVKTVWELSRCHFLLWLGQAYKLTSDIKYAKSLIALISNWISHNPYACSINWTCPMEVAIRAINWMYSLCFVADYVEDKVLAAINQNLFLHGRFIYENLEEQYKYNANHYATNVLGLLYIGALYKDSCSEAGTWYEYAKKAFDYEVRTQLLPSGAHFERSISYHRLISEIFLFSYSLISRIEERYNQPLDIRARLIHMVDFVEGYLKPSTRAAPQLGDNDDGRILPFIPRPYCEHQYILSLGKKILGRGYDSDVLHGEALYVEPTNLLNEITSSKYTGGSYIAEDAGFAFLRNNHFYAAFTNTGISRYLPSRQVRKIGTHTHIDMLSIELSTERSDFIVDPGSYTYTADKVKRDLYRSAESHNVAIVERNNGFRFDAHDYFSIMGDLTNPCPILYIKQENSERVTSSLHLKSKGLQYTRAITLHPTSVSIEDSITRIGATPIVWNFHLQYGVDAEISNSNQVIFKSTNGELLTLSIETDMDISLSLEKCYISLSYGVEVPSLKLIVTQEAKAQTKISFTFR